MRNTHNKTGKVVAYRRVSTKEQELGRQLFQTDITFDLEFSDKLSGKDMKNRKGFQECVESLVFGDTLYFHDISRCARNTQQLLEVVKLLTERGITVVFYKENLEFGGKGGDALKEAMSSMMLTLLGAVHTFQRTMQNSSTKDGLERAKAKGVKLGAANENWKKANRGMAEKQRRRTRDVAIKHAEKYRKEVEMMISMRMALDPIAQKLKELKLYTLTDKPYTASGVKNLCRYLGLEGKTAEERYNNMMTTK